MTHRGGRDTAGALQALLEVGAPSAASTLRFDADGDAQARPRGGPGLEVCATPSARRRPVHRARRRRHDPHARCGATPGPSVPSSPSTSARSASWPRSTPTACAEGFERAFSRRVRDDGAAGDHGRAPRRRLGRVQRHLRAPPAGQARRRPRLRARRRGDRPRALRRARGLHAGGLDGLQPRQRRPGAGLGRGGLRRLVHRAALVHRAGAGRRAERRADDPQRARATTRSRSTSTAARAACCPPARTSRSSSARSYAAAGPAAGRELLPPPARAVRPPGAADGPSGRADPSAAGGTPCGRCCTSCASRTSC